MITYVQIGSTWYMRVQLAVNSVEYRLLDPFELYHLGM
jgi:hypothetical protein